MENNELKNHGSGCRVIGDEVFKLVPASKLSLSDDFLEYIPRTNAEAAFKRDVKKVIEVGVQDFYRATIDPSFDNDGRLCYQSGMMPAVGKTYDWWDEHAKKYCPERKSRLGTKSEYIAFLAVLIKEMVASGKSLECAWNAVCNDSKELENCGNSNDYKSKYLAYDKVYYCYWRTGISSFLSDDIVLARLYSCTARDVARIDSTGWIVLS